LEDHGVDGMMIYEYFLERLAHDRGKWRAVVNAVMNLGVLAPRS
jgi:membrane-associated PAP2 superfamily phosphatase